MIGINILVLLMKSRGRERSVIRQSVFLRSAELGLQHSAHNPRTVLPIQSPTETTASWTMRRNHVWIKKTDTRKSWLFVPNFLESADYLELMP